MTGTQNVVATLRAHWLAGLDCHEQWSLDRARCACSTVDLGWQVSVGAAVDTWIAHVLAMLWRAHDALAAKQAEAEAVARLFNGDGA